MKNIQEFHPRVEKNTWARLSQNLVWFPNRNVYVMPFLKIPHQYNIERFHMHDVTGAILVFQNNETVAILVFQTNHVGVELFTYTNNFFCSHKFA